MRGGDQVVGGSGAPGTAGSGGPGAAGAPGPAPFAVSERSESAGTILGVRGELDICTAPSLEARLDQIVRDETGDLIVDLRDLEFIDSAGLHILVGAQQRLTSQSRQLKVMCRPGSVRRLIELARLSETLGLRAG
jgi:anti-sigma B factor antagonist